VDRSGNAEVGAVTHILTLPSGEQMHFQLELRQRRTIGLKITPSGLVVHAPKRISKGQLETIILQKASWISKKLQALSARQVPELQWQHGEQLWLLGQYVTLDIEQNVRTKAVQHVPGKLLLALPEPHDREAVARKVVQWYVKQAKEDFLRRLEILSAKLGVPTPVLLISNARTRWGSCNSKKEIRLNWRLYQAPPHLINYVVCHELAHLKEMNHSARFWSVVASLYPDYKEAEKSLKAWSPKLHAM